MKADWKLRHEMEPDENLLLQFTHYDESEDRWNCLFSKEGKLCVIFRRFNSPGFS